MKFAPGTPESVMRDREEKFYGNKNKRDEATPPLKITAEMQKKAAAYDQKKQEMAAREAAMAAAAERAARPRTGVAGPYMPTFKTPSISPAEKAKQAADLAAKIEANTPVPARPTPVKPTSRSLNPRPPVVQPVPSRSVAPPVDRPGVAVQAKAPPMPMGAGPTSPASLQPQPMPIGPKPMDTMKTPPAMKKGGKVKASSYKSGGNVSTASSASKRGDGIAQRGKTKGRML